jgi:hypothetical protein
MKLRLIATISAFAAMTAIAHAQEGVPKSIKADVENVVQIVTNDKAKMQA